MPNLEQEYYEYDGLVRESWYAVSGLEDPITQRVLERIKLEINTVGYSLWLVGGILENWETRDIDINLVGPWNPITIKRIMRRVLEIGFEEGLLIDIKYQFENTLFDFKRYLDNNIEIKDYKFAELSDSFTSNINTTKLEGEWQEGLFIRWIQLPMQKQIEKNKLTGFVYKPSKRLT